MADEQTVDTSLKAHIAAEEAALHPPADPTPPVVEAAQKPVEPPVETPAVETPEQEAEGLKPDAEVSEAARTLRKNRADKRLERVRAENDELARELHRRRELRSELERPAPAQPPTEGHVSQAAVADPDDPEPKEEDFAEYAEYLKGHARWSARDEFRKQQAATRARATRAESEQRAAQHAGKLDAQHEALRAKFSDADAVIGSLLDAVRDNARAPVIAEFLANSEVEDLAYRLGKDPTALKAVLDAPSAHAVSRALARIEASILASKAAPKPVTKAPAPPSTTVGGASTASSVDTTKPGTSLKDHIRIEEAEIAERRRAGYRY